jgi:hypothetical protein
MKLYNIGIIAIIASNIAAKDSMHLKVTLAHVNTPPRVHDRLFTGLIASRQASETAVLLLGWTIGQPETVSRPWREPPQAVS